VKPSVADRILERLTGFTEALESGEPIAAKFTCRQIELDLKPISYKPEKVKKIRQALGASQPVFAKLLGVTVQTVRAWEQGVNALSHMACRFLDEIDRNPTYWRDRLKGAAVPKGSRRNRDGAEA
jgi:putative transcriptional regulator